MSHINWQNDKSFWAFCLGVRWTSWGLQKDSVAKLLSGFRQLALWAPLLILFFDGWFPLRGPTISWIDCIVLCVEWILAKCISSFLCGLCVHSVTALHNVYTFHFFCARWFINWQMLQGWMGEVAVCDVNLHYCLDPELWIIIWYRPFLVLGCILFLLLFPECVPPRHSNKIISSKPLFSRFCSAECVCVGVGWMPEENGFPNRTQGARQLCNCCYLQYSVTLLLHAYTLHTWTQWLSFRASSVAILFWALTHSSTTCFNWAFFTSSQ